jgi:hypothetical protein
MLLPAQRPRTHSCGVSGATPRHCVVADPAKSGGHGAPDGFDDAESRCFVGYSPVRFYFLERFLSARGGRALRLEYLDPAHGDSGSTFPNCIPGHRSSHQSTRGGQRQCARREYDQSDNNLDQRVTLYPGRFEHSLTIREYAGAPSLRVDEGKRIRAPAFNEHYWFVSRYFAPVVAVGCGASSPIILELSSYRYGVRPGARAVNFAFSTPRSYTNHVFASGRSASFAMRLR